MIDYIGWLKDAYKDQLIIMSELDVIPVSIKFGNQACDASAENTLRRVIVNVMLFHLARPIGAGLQGAGNTERDVSLAQPAGAADLAVSQRQGALPAWLGTKLFAASAFAPTALGVFRH